MMTKTFIKGMKEGQTGENACDLAGRDWCGHKPKVAINL